MVPALFGTKIPPGDRASMCCSFFKNGKCAKFTACGFSHDPEHDKPKGGKADGNSKGGKPDREPNRGGWMPRVSVLVAQVMQKKWNDITEIMWKWYAEYPLLKLVDKKVKAIKNGW